MSTTRRPAYSSMISALAAVFVLMSAPTSVTAHDTDHAFAIGSEGLDYARDVASDDEGNAYLAGRFGDFGGETDFDPSSGFELRRPRARNGDAFVAKYTPGGDLDWVITVPADGDARGVYAHGDWVYVAGWFGGTRDFDPGPGVTRLTAVGYTDGYVMRVRRSDGAFSWAVRFGGTRRVCPDLSREWTEAIAVSGGRVYVAGLFEGPVDFDPGPETVKRDPGGRCDGSGDGYVLSLDAENGAFDFVSTITGPGREFILDMDVNEDGGIVAAGAFSRLTDFDPGPGTVYRRGSPDGSGFLLKLTPDGRFDWVKKLPGGTYGVAVGPGGSIYGAGTFTGAGDFDAGPTEAWRNGGDVGNAYVVGYSADGRFRWVATAASTDASEGEAISVDALGRVVTAGSFAGKADFDPGPGVARRRSAGGGRFGTRLDAYVWVLSDAGAFVGAHRLGGRGWQDARAVATAGTDILITGVLVRTADFDPGAGRLPVTSHGSMDAYLVRLSDQ